MDGIVLDGLFLIDELMILGELLLIEKFVGDIVVGVIFNIIGIIVIEVICVGEEIVLF